VESNLSRAHAIIDYRFPTVDIRKTAATQDEDVTDEDVAEIFVRINNQGTRLGQADFVLTLLSVFHGDLRDKIERRARAMSDGAVVGIDPQQLLRAICGVAFGRARMSAIYRFLRGLDPTTGDADPSARVKRLNQLDEAADECMEATPWRDYLLCVQHAGLITQALVASKNAIGRVSAANGCNGNCRAGTWRQRKFAVRATLPGSSTPQMLRLPIRTTL
jgi:uncharacterized metal-binding protein